MLSNRHIKFYYKSRHSKISGSINILIYNQKIPIFMVIELLSILTKIIQCKIP